MADYSDALIEWGSNTTTMLDFTKGLLGIETIDPSRDDEVSLFIQMAGEACEMFIDNKIFEQNVTERFVTLQSPIALRYWPAGALVSVLRDTVDETTDWEIYIQDGIQWTVRYTGGSGSGYKQLDITYAAGYNPVPSDLAYAVAKTAIGYERQGGGANSGSVSKETIVGVGSIEYNTNEDGLGSVGMLSPTTVGTLNMYRRWHV